MMPALDSVGPPHTLGHRRAGDVRPFAAAAIALFALHLALTYPGVMSWDSKFQYQQAVTGVFDDWMPPIMARLWRLLLPVSQAGSALLALHLACYWLAQALVASALARAGKAGLAWAALLIGALPHLVLLSSFIHKDVGHAVTATAAFAIVLWRRSGGRRLGWPAGVAVAALLAYATLVRANGVFGTAPIALYAFWPKLGAHRHRLALGLVASAAIVLLSFPVRSVIDHQVLKARPNDQILSLVHFDLAGIAYFSRDASVYPEKPPGMATVDRCYRPQMWDDLNMRADCKGELGVHNGVKNKKKTIAWVEAAIRHPLAYAQHRIAHFNEELYGVVPPQTWFWAPFDSPIIGHVPPGRIQAFTETALDDLSNSPIFAPLTSYVLGLAVLAMLAWRRRLDDVWLDGAFAISFAGSLYTTGYLVVGVASMYRYQEFGMTAAPLAAVLLLAGSPRSAWRGVVTTIAAPTIVTAVVVAVARHALA